jgi:hypothetical protein
MTVPGGQSTAPICPKNNSKVQISGQGSIENSQCPVDAETAAVFGIEMRENMDALAYLALQFFDKYPWQNIRALRNFIIRRSGINSI